MKYMLDTNIVIKLIRDKSENLKTRLREKKIEDICVSVITYCELEYGVSRSEYKEKNRIALMTIMSGIKVLPLEENVAKIYGELRANLERNGNVIGPNDLLIAAHAKAMGLTLVTNNVKEFTRVDGLTVEDWS